MKNNKLTNLIMKKMNALLDDFAKNPDKMTDDDRNALERLYSALCKAVGISEHTQWRVTWEVRKWADTARKLAGFEPDEIVYDTQNIVLDSGANEMLKLITGTGGSAFSAANSYIYVGTDSTAENSAQTGVLASGSNRAYARLESGYPIVEGRQMIFQAAFGDSEANFAWNEAAIANGIGSGAVAMNRKVQSLGTKVTGTWSLRITISLTST